MEMPSLLRLLRERLGETRKYWWWQYSRDRKRRHVTGICASAMDASISTGLQHPRRPNAPWTTLETDKRGLETHVSGMRWMKNLATFPVAGRRGTGTRDPRGRSVSVCPECVRYPRVLMSAPWRVRLTDRQLGMAVEYEQEDWSLLL
jgi:hypothetical protein